MAWFVLELALKKKSQSTNSNPKGILTLTQCKQRANRIEYFKNNSRQFDAAMQHLVKHNIFLHYPKVLPDVVFCDPQVLLTLVTEIVWEHYKVKYSGHTVKGTMFKDYAYISAAELKFISPQYSDKVGNFTPELFLNLLSELKVISALNKNGQYLMPALLQNAEDLDTQVGEIDEKQLLVPLCISFEGGCAPSGVFCSLVTTLLQSDWKLCMYDGKPYCCFRNCVTFIYQVTAIITLVERFSHFSIYMYIPTDGSEYVSPVTIRDEVHESLRTVADCLHYSNLTFNDAIECPQCKHKQPEKTHVAVLSGKTYQCTFSDTHAGTIPRDYHIWMKTIGMLKGMGSCVAGHV